MPKVVYFNAQGSAQQIRNLLHYANVEFEDVKYSFETWPEAKASGQYGENPNIPMYIEEDGTIYKQSTAILNFLAAKHNILPADANEVYESTWFFETEHDWRSKAGWGAGIMKNEPTQEEIERTIELQGGFMEALDKQWADGRTHAAGNSVTTADFAVLSFYTAKVTNERAK